LDFYGNGEILVFEHVGGVLAMQHDTAVFISPSFAALHLVACKTIFHRENIMGIWLFVKDMSVLLVETVIVIIRYFHYAVFHPESVAKIIFIIVPFNFYCPTLKVFSVKQLLPFSLSGVLCIGKYC